MTQAPARPADSGTDLILSTALAEQFNKMIAIVPDAEEGGVVNILEQIFSAEDAAGLESPWSDQDRGLPLGIVVQVTAMTKRASDFRDGLGFYLELDCIILHSGEVAQYVTGSVSVVAQLVKAYSLDLFPLTIKLVEAEKASKAGYKPQHLEIIENTAKPARSGKRG